MIGNLIFSPLPDVLLWVGVRRVRRKIDEKIVGEFVFQGFSDQLSFVKSRIVPYQADPLSWILLENEF